MTPHRYQILLDEVAALARVPRHFLDPFDLKDHPNPDRVRVTTSVRTQTAQHVVEAAINWTLADGNPFLIGKRPVGPGPRPIRGREFLSRMDKLRELQREVMKEIWA